MRIIITHLYIMSLLVTWMFGTRHLRSEELDRLDRGHRILIERGLQIHALTFGTENSHWWNGWEQSRFTAASFQSRSPVGQNIQPDDLWASWIGSLSDPGRSMSAEATPFLPGLVSWCFRDELDLDDPQNRAIVKTWIEAYRPQLPNTLLHTSEFGSQVSVANMQRYMQESRPDMVYFDTYPFRTDEPPIGGSPWFLYRDMVKYRDLGLAGHDGTGKTPIPYGMWLQTFRFAYQDDNSNASVLWSPSESEMRLSQFAAWTFGFKHVSAFTYVDVFEQQIGGRIKFIDSPFFTGAFHSTASAAPELLRYAEINRQSLNLGPALTRLLSTDIRLIPGPAWTIGGKDPKSTTQMDLWDDSADPYMTNITAENLGSSNHGHAGDVLVGYFTPLLERFSGEKCKNEIYFMMTNGLSARDKVAANVAQRMTIKFDFGRSGITSLQRLRRRDGQVEVVDLQPAGGSLYALDLVLPGGTGDLFKFNTGAPFVGVPVSP